MSSFKSHGVSLARLASDGVPAKPELAEFMTLTKAAITAGVRIVAHNASFDVRALNHTAIHQGIPPSFSSASMLCTMHAATRHCGLRKRGSKQFKAPSSVDLFIFLFGQKPMVPLDCALTISSSCRMTLASYIEGHKRKWW
mmetsp:Transcript_28298/g.70260  ORF Transcript_28298/g.70260 Transcript_28298/m.70260 type:complete len:141 (+) Transcript_28298:1-423(+)